MGDTAGERGRTPVWQAIANALRADITAGRYRAGDKLPTEAALAARFGVNRHTVRHGLKALVDDGLVRTRRGAGAFVAAVPTEYPIGKRTRFTENLTRAGRLPGRSVLSTETRAATDKEAVALDLPESAPVLVVWGVSLADAQPVALAQSLYPVDRLPGIAEALAQGRGVTWALGQVGVTDYTRAQTQITAVAADATQALHLHLREGAPLLRTRSLNVDRTGAPVESGTTWWPGDRITLTLED
ncbi:phosphonate metabolism transcriptional regulator PhnF [Sagittula sp. SSi028]|uniref:phosphonate metabolism transcriptional regulator PhnF n=1 Tax=Sagittula sp. SSi028 TaxID=3400636 RepID=UPI003AF8AD2D